LTGAGLNVRINLETLAVEGSCPRDLLDEVLAWVTQNRMELLQEWEKWHP